MRSTGDAPARRFWWSFETPWGLALMFALALGIRLAIAPKYGFYGDLNLFRRWAAGLHDVGIRNFYVANGDTTFVYPPGYLYILDLLANISRIPSYLLLKLPAILGDLGLAWLAGVFAVRLAPEDLRRRVPVRAAAVAAVLFNPAVIALSVVWGQVDSVPAFFVVASLLLLLTGKPSMPRDTFAIVLFAIAFAMKPQSSFVFPVVGYVLYRRYLHHRSFAEIGWGLARIVAIGAPGLALFAFSGVPFGLSPVALKDFYSKASAGYKITSVWAFNAWGVAAFQRGDVRGAYSPSGRWLFVAGLPAFDVGVLGFAAATVFVLWQVHRAVNREHDPARVLLAAAVMESLLAFTLLTRMHERYLFPVLAFLAPLVLWRGFRYVYIAVSALFVINLWYPFAVYNRYWGVTTFQFHPLYGWLFGGIDVIDTWQKKMWSLFMVVACAVLVLRGFRWVARIDGPRPPGREPAAAPLAGSVA